MARLFACLWVGTLVALFYHTNYTGPDTWLHYAVEGGIVIATGFVLYGAIELARRRRT